MSYIRKITSPGRQSCPSIVWGTYSRELCAVAIVHDDMTWNKVPTGFSLSKSLITFSTIHFDLIEMNVQLSTPI